jgi:hypothetical protein
MSPIEVFWPSSAPESVIDEARRQLRGAGVESVCHVVPRRRGPDATVLVIMAAPAIEPMLDAVFRGVGGDAYTTLRGFVRRLFRVDSEPDKPPTAVVFESSTTRERFVFTPSMPDEAFRLAVELESDGEPGRWIWESSEHRWMRIEE